MAIAVTDELQEREGLGANRALTALRGSSMSVSAIFLQNIEPLRVLPAKHRASRYALEARRMAIAVTDELQESVGSDSNRALRAVCGRQVFFLQTIARADVPWRPVEWRLP